MNWMELTGPEQLEELKEMSKTAPQVIFKHSTRCSISKTAWNRVGKSEVLPADATFYYLDLLAHRGLSDQIAADFGVEHESPQVLVIKDGKSVYDADHFGITVDELAEAIA